MIRTGSFLEGQNQQEQHSLSVRQKELSIAQNKEALDFTKYAHGRKKQQEEWQDKQRDAKIKMMKKQYNTMATSNIDTAIMEAGNGNFNKLRKAMTSNDESNFNADVKARLENTLGGQIIDVRHPERRAGEENDDKISPDEVTIEYITKSGERATTRVSLASLGGSLGTDRRVGVNEFHSAMSKPYPSKTDGIDDAIRASIDFNGNMKGLSENLFYAGVVGGNKEAKELYNLIGEEGAKSTKSLLEHLSVQFGNEKDPKKRLELEKKMKRIKTLVEKLNPPKKSVDTVKANMMTSINEAVASGDFEKAKMLMQTLEGTSRALDPSKGKNFSIEQAVEMVKAGKSDKALEVSLATGNVKAKDALYNGVLKAVMDKDYAGAERLRMVVDPKGNADVITHAVGMVEDGKKPAEVEAYLKQFGLGAKPATGAKKSVSQQDRELRQSLLTDVNTKIDAGTVGEADVDKALTDVPPSYQNRYAKQVYNQFKRSEQFKAIDLRKPELRGGELDAKGQKVMKVLESIEAGANVAETAIRKPVDNIDGTITAVRTFNNVTKEIDKLLALDMWKDVKGTGAWATVQQQTLKWLGDVTSGDKERATLAHKKAKSLGQSVQRVEDLQKRAASGEITKAERVEMADLKGVVERDMRIKYDTQTFFVLKKMLNAISGMGVTDKELQSYKSHSVGDAFDSIDSLRKRLIESSIAFKTQNGPSAFSSLERAGAVATAYKKELELRQAGKHIWNSAAPEADVNVGINVVGGNTRPTIQDHQAQGVAKSLGKDVSEVTSISNQMMAHLSGGGSLGTLQEALGWSKSRLATAKAIYAELKKFPPKSNTPAPANPAPAPAPANPAPAPTEKVNGDLNTNTYIDLHKLEGLEHTTNDGRGRTAWGGVDKIHQREIYDKVESGELTPAQGNEAVYKKLSTAMYKKSPEIAGFKRRITKEVAEVMAMNVGVGQKAFTDKKGKKHKTNGVIAMLPTLRLIEAGKFDEAMKHIARWKIETNHRNVLFKALTKAKEEAK